MRLTRLMAALLVLGLLMAACGGDGGAGESAGGEAGTADGGEGGGEELVIDGEVVADAETWAAAQEEGGLLLYTGLTEANEIAIIDEFTADTGLTVDYVRLSENRLHERILTEHGANQLQADAIRIADISMVNVWDEEGILEPHQVPMWDEIDEQWRGPDGNHYIGFQTAYMIGYNSAEVDESEAPTSWLDLLDERWRGRNGLVQVAAGGSVWALAMFQRQVVADDYWEQLAANDPVILPGAANVTQELSRGELLVASVLPRVLNAAIEDGAPVELVVPEEGAAMYNFHISKTSVGQNPNAADVFVNWQMSKRGQTVFSQIVGDYPVRDDVPPPTVGGEPLPGRDEATLWTFDPDDWTSLREDWTAEWFDTFDYTPEA